MGLSPQALLDRRQGIGGSDAAKIIAGGEEWLALWLDKTGRREPDDLSGNFAVQLGIATENLNLDWYERVFGRKVVRRGEVVISAATPFLRVTLDGFDAEEETGVQAKHVNPYAKVEEIRARYEAQCRHEMIVLECPRWILSVIIGTNAPVYEPFETDEFWNAEYVDRCREFWDYVIRDQEPPNAGSMAMPKPKDDPMRVVDMTGNNAWANYAADWIANGKAAKTFTTAEKELKKLVEDDVKEAFGAAIVIKRDKAGRLSIKEK